MSLMVFAKKIVFKYLKLKFSNPNIYKYFKPSEVKIQVEHCYFTNIWSPVALVEVN